MHLEMESLVCLWMCCRESLHGSVFILGFFAVSEHGLCISLILTHRRSQSRLKTYKKRHNRSSRRCACFLSTGHIVLELV